MTPPSFFPNSFATFQGPHGSIKLYYASCTELTRYALLPSVWRLAKCQNITWRIVRKARSWNLHGPFRNSNLCFSRLPGDWAGMSQCEKGCSRELSQPLLSYLPNNDHYSLLSLFMDTCFLLCDRSLAYHTTMLVYYPPTSIYAHFNWVEPVS